ncbi:YitT family protein [Terrisporobacter glycolicus]|nr:YitT family protein [Terrisporobacter glycolicus]
MIYMVAGILFGWDRALYSIMTYFITYKIIDIVSEGLDQEKAALIITAYNK